MERTLPMILQWDESFDIGSDTLTGVNDADYQPPFPLTAKLNKLTIKVDRPQLTEEDIKKLEGAQSEALDGKPLQHVRPGPAKAEAITKTAAHDGSWKAPKRALVELFVAQL